jgi:hypothetical protein
MISDDFLEMIQDDLQESLLPEPALCSGRYNIISCSVPDSTDSPRLTKI